MAMPISAARRMRATSARDFQTDKTHERLSASRSKKDYFVLLRYTALHPRRSGWHTWDGQSDGARSFFQESLDGRRRDMSLKHVSIDLGGVASREISRHS
jgi:hypothetical protein